jgi:hypothetical protein
MFAYSCANKESQTCKDENKPLALDTLSGKVPGYEFQIDTPVCADDYCQGRYKGVEFVSQSIANKLGLTGTDIAHNYSNKIADFVGNKLKEMYRKGKYIKVDLKRIEMTTKGMDDGDAYVEYRVKIPFMRVKNAKDAMTGFDHSGGWGHSPDLRKRKEELLNGSRKIVKNNKLFISPLYKTPEGLEEYWIQWRHTDYQ